MAPTKVWYDLPTLGTEPQDVRLYSPGYEDSNENILSYICCTVRWDEDEGHR